MFMLTPAQGIVVAGGWLTLLALLLLGVFRLLPRSRRIVPVSLTCPVLGRRVGAEAARDEWTRGFDAVVRCDALGRCAPVTCNQRCLKMAVEPLAGV